jgi:hypothetical protein
MNWGLLGAIALVAVVLWYLTRPKARAGRAMDRLEARYLAQDGRSKREARAAMERQIAALRERFPGQTRRWYLERALADAKRAQR